jgi:inner membrane transporter RhtA
MSTQQIAPVNPFVPCVIPATSAKPRTGLAKGPLAAALLILGSGTSLQAGAAMAERLFPVAGAAGAVLLRLGLSAVIMLVLVRPRVRAWQRSQWRAVTLYGLSLAGTNGFFYAALARLPLGTAVTIQFLGPLTLAAVLSRRPRDVAWVLLAVTGVLTLGLADTHGSGGGHPLNGVGVACALISAAFWALYIVAGGRASKAVPGRGGLAVAMAVAAVAVAPFGARGAGHVLAQAPAQPHLLLLALGTAVLASVVPYTLELAALRRAPRRVFGILLSTEPAVATLAGWLLLSQQAGPVTLAAVTVVVLASTGSALGARPEGSGAAAPRPAPARSA